MRICQGYTAVLKLKKHFTGGNYKNTKKINFYNTWYNFLIKDNNICKM